MLGDNLFCGHRLTAFRQGGRALTEAPRSSPRAHDPSASAWGVSTTGAGPDDRGKADQAKSNYAVTGCISTTRGADIGAQGSGRSARHESRDQPISTGAISRAAISNVGAAGPCIALLDAGTPSARLQPPPPVHPDDRGQPATSGCLRRGDRLAPGWIDKAALNAGHA